MLPGIVLAATTYSPDPYVILSRARSQWQLQSYAPFLSYSVRISGVSAGTTITNTYASSVDTETDQINVRATSAEEVAHPYVPRGVNVKSNFSISWAGNQPVGAAPTVDGPPAAIRVTKVVPVTKREQFDLLGVPLLSPTYSFGLSPASSPSALSEPEPIGPASPTTMKTIAHVTAVRRDYDVRFDGIETVDGIPCYHLDLSPKRDPAVFRLRQLWIEEIRYITRQAIVQGNFTQGPGPKLPWLIHFNVAAGLMYVDNETAMTPVSYLGKTYSSVSIAFSDIRVAHAGDLYWGLSMFRTSGDVLKEP